MNKKLTTLLILFLLVVSSVNVFAYDDKEVINIKILGNKFVPNEQIKAHLFTKTGNTFSIERLKKDLEAIRNMGYFQNVQANVTNYKNGKQIIYQLTENKVLSDIEINNNESVSKEKIKNLLDLKSLEIINLNEVNNGIKRIKKYYHKKGYNLIEINKEIQDSILKINIKEGRINKILIKGNKDISSTTIRAEIFLEPNKIFNKMLAKRSKENLMKTGYFNGVDYEVKKLTNEEYKDKNYYNVVFNLNEGATFPFGIGIRYNDLKDFRYLLGYKKVNARGQGQKVHFLRNKGPDQEIYDLEYFRPSTEDMTFSILTNLKNKDYTTLDNIEYKVNKGRIGFGYNVNSLISTEVGFNYGKYERKNQPSNKTLKLDIIAEYNTLDTKLKEGNQQYIRTEFVKNQPDKDNLDEKDFVRVIAKSKNYIPLQFTETNNFLVELKAVGTTNSSSIPDYYKTYLTELNGASEELFKKKDNYSGHNKVYGNLEYQFTPFEQQTNHKLKDLTFYSYYNAGQTMMEGLDIDNLHQTIGLGFKLNTPLGKVDLKYNKGQSKIDKDLMNDITFTLTKKY